MAPLKDDFRESLANILQLGKYSDLTIRCQDKVFLAHCVVVCAQSSVIDRAIDGRLRGQEARKREYNFDDGDPDIISMMMDYLYKGDYDDERTPSKLTNLKSAPPAREPPPIVEEPFHEEEYPPSPLEAPSPEQANSEENFISPDTEKRLGHLELDSSDDVSHKSPLEVNADMYILADKYDLQQLKDLSASKYQKIAPSSWDSPGFHKSVQTVYENTMDSDRLLRDIIVNVACDQVNGLLGRREFVDLLRSNGELSTDILELIVHDKQDVVQESFDDWGFNANAKAKGKKGKSRGLLMN